MGAANTNLVYGYAIDYKYGGDGNLYGYRQFTVLSINLSTMASKYDDMSLTKIYRTIRQSCFRICLITGR